MFTTQEKQVIDQLKAQGKTPQQIAGYIGGLRTNAPSTLSRELGEEPKQFDESTLSRIVKDAPSDIVETGKRAFGATNEAGKSIVDTFKRDDIGMADKVVTAGSQAFKGIGRFLGETFLGAAKLTTTDEFEKQGAEAMQEVGTKLAKTDLVQDTMAWYESQDDNKKQMIKNVLGYVEGATELVGAGTGTRAFKATLNAGKEVAKLPKEAFEEVVNFAKQGRPEKSIRLVNESLDEATRKTAIDKLADIYNSSMVENRQAINTKLDKLAQEQTFGDKRVTRDDLVMELAKEGYVPDVKERLADFRGVFDDIKERQSRVMQALEPILKNTKATTRLDEFENRIINQVNNNPQIGADYQKTIDEVKRIMESYRVNPRYGANKPAAEVDLTAEMVNNIRKEMNSRFDNSDVSVSRSIFETDSDYAVGKAAREWLDEAVPDESARKANAEWARLNTIRQTAEAFNNQQIDVGVWGRALTGYMTVVGSGVVGGIAAGPVGAMTMGILTKIGGDKLADMLRKKAFNPEVTAKIRQAMRQDDELVAKLMETADQQSKDSIKDFLLEAPKDDLRSSISSGKTIETGGLDANGKKIEPGLTERAEPGAIKTPGTTKFLQMQANRYKTPEAFISAVNNNPAWLAKFKEMGTTPEEISTTAFAGRTAAMEANKQYIAQIGDKLVSDLTSNKSKQSINSIVNQAKKDYAMTTEEAEMLRTYLNDATLGMIDDSKKKIIDSDYVYHSTGKRNIDSIVLSGLRPNIGQYGKGVYFAPDIEKSKGWGGPDEAIIRVKRSNLDDSFQEFEGEQGWVENKILPENLEISIDGGKTWLPASEFDK